MSGKIIIKLITLYSLILILSLPGHSYARDITKCSSTLGKWFSKAYEEGVGVADLKIDYEEYELSLLFYLLPELEQDAKIKIAEHRFKKNLSSLFFLLSKEYSLFWEIGSIHYTGCITPAIYRGGLNEFDAVIIYGDYPKLSTLILSAGNNKINKIIVNGEDPLYILKNLIVKNGDKQFWRKLIMDQIKN